MCRRALVILFLLLTVICNAQDSTSQWIWMKGDVTIPEYAIYGQRGVPSKNNTPGPRFESCKWTDKNGRLWLFGGLSMDQFQNRLALNDLWQYDPSTDEWTWISGDSTNRFTFSLRNKGCGGLIIIIPAQCLPCHTGLTAAAISGFIKIVFGNTIHLLINGHG